MSLCHLSKPLIYTKVNQVRCMFSKPPKWGTSSTAATNLAPSTELLFQTIQLMNISNHQDIQTDLFHQIGSKPRNILYWHFYQRTYLSNSIDLLIYTFYSLLPSIGYHKYKPLVKRLLWYPLCSFLRLQQLKMLLKTFVVTSRIKK